MECPECKNEEGFYLSYQKFTINKDDSITIVCPDCNHRWDVYLITPARIEAVEETINFNSGMYSSPCPAPPSTRKLKSAFAPVLKKTETE